MCGVSHSAQTYLSRLINLGYKVAIAEQLEQEEERLELKKHQKIFKRDVVRIITPEQSSTILYFNQKITIIFLVSVF